MKVIPTPPNLRRTQWREPNFRHSSLTSCPLDRLGLLVLLAYTTVPFIAQAPQAVPGAGIDREGNIFVSAKDGHPIIMATASHCPAALGTIDGKTMICLVARDLGENGYLPPLRFEVYSSGGKKLAIEPGGPIRDWHLWNDQHAIAISFTDEKGLARDSLYEIATGKRLESIDEPSDRTKLPQWAKSRAQTEDEAVPSSPALAMERTAWIAKIFRQLHDIRPGMRRKDLAPLLHTEGGLSTRTQQTYVLTECPYIEVVVHFKPPAATDTSPWGQPEDVIESISTPFLGYGIYD
jgi:hypothetical protein